MLDLSLVQLLRDSSTHILGWEPINDRNHVRIEANAITTRTGDTSDWIIDLDPDHDWLPARVEAVLRSPTTPEGVKTTYFVVSCFNESETVRYQLEETVSGSS